MAQQSWNRIVIRCPRPRVIFKAAIGLVAVAVLTVAAAPSATTGVNPKQIVGKLEHRGFLSKKFGTAWCINSDCDVFVTNYHVTAVVGSHAKINGVNVIESLSATSEHDQDAGEMRTVIGPLKLAYIRDIALVRTKEPLTRKGMRPVPLYLGELRPGQTVTAIGFPAGKLQAISGQFAEEGAEGMLRFDVAQEVAEGLSGGVVLDEAGRAVGLVSGSGLRRDMMYAVPIWALADFIRAAQPPLYAKLFSGREIYRGRSGEESAEIAEDVVDVFGLDLPSSDQKGFSPNPVLPRSYLLFDDAAAATRPIERYSLSDSVLALRRNAQVTSQQMKNFVAQQRLLTSNGRAWQHELQVIDGAQRFRPLDGSKDIFELPIKGGPVPGSEWADLLKVIGFNSSFAVQLEDEITIENQTMKVFRYKADREDHICELRVARPFRRVWKGSLPCSGVIWTDERFNILRVTQDMATPEETELAAFRIVILYGWWGQKLVPAEMYITQTTRGGKTLATRAKFDNYQLFTATTKIFFKEPPLPLRRLPTPRVRR